MMGKLSQCFIFNLLMMFLLGSPQNILKAVMRDLLRGIRAADACASPLERIQSLAKLFAYETAR